MQNQIIAPLLSLVYWWIGSYCGLIVLTAVVMGIVCRYTTWGRKFWQINKPILFGKDALTWWKYLNIALMCLAWEVYLIPATATALQRMIDSLEQHDSSLFMANVIILLIISIIELTLGVVGFFVGGRLILCWRQLLTQRFQKLWVKRDNYYLFQFLATPIDNPDQRVDLDTADFANKSVNLFSKVIVWPFMMVVISKSLWDVSPSLTVGTFVVPKVAMLFALCAIVASIGCAVFFGHPLIHLNFRQMLLEANYRYALANLRANSKEVALLDAGEQSLYRLDRHFDQVVGNTRRIIRKETALNFFRGIFSNPVQIIVYIILAPAYFRDKISLGIILQNGALVTNFVRNFRDVVELYPSFTDYLAATNRLSGFLAAVQQIQAIELLTPTPIDSGFRVQDFSVCTPDNRVIIAHCSLSCKPGQSLLITGASGIGKSSTMLALAGLWPYVSGTVYLPDTGQYMFVPQQWYLSSGTLRSLFYVRADSGPSDAQILAMLASCDLGELMSDLDSEQNWSEVLSPGQIQRIAIARAILAHPKVLFLDEATSALDEDLEARMYQLIYDQLPSSTIVSIAHRSTIRHLGLSGGLCKVVVLS